jgi:hypothetical protein
LKKLFTILLLFAELNGYSQDFVRTDITLVNEILAIDKSGSIYYCNKVKCNGRKVSYWGNANFHILGKFRNGLPYDTLKIYNYEGELIVWDVIDTITGITKHLNSEGSLIKSSTINSTTFYDEKGKIEKTVFHTNLPSTYLEWIVTYDSLGNEYSIGSSFIRFNEFQNKKLLKLLVDKFSGYEDIFELTITSEETTYFLDQKYYIKQPFTKKEIENNSIIGNIFKKNNIYYFRSSIRNKMFRIGKKY